MSATAVLSYAALAIHEDGLSISEDKLSQMAASSGHIVSDVDIRMFAKAFRDIDMNSLISQALSHLRPVASQTDTVVKVVEVDVPVQDDDDDIVVPDLFTGDDDDEGAIDNLFGEDDDY